MTTRKRVDMALHKSDLLLFRPAFRGMIHGLQIRLHLCDIGGIARRADRARAKRR
jgi:hypothetical protein